MWLHELVEEEVITLECDDHRAVELAFQHRDEAADEEVRQVEKLWLLLSEPIDQLGDFACLVAVFAT